MYTVVRRYKCHKEGAVPPHFAADGGNDGSADVIVRLTMSRHGSAVRDKVVDTNGTALNPPYITGTGEHG